MQIVPLLRNLCDQRRLVANPGLIVEEHAQRRLGIVAGAGEAAEQSTFLVAGRIADAEFYTDIPRSCAGEHEFGFFAVKINVAFLLIVNVAVNRRQAGKLNFRTAGHKDPGRIIFRLTIIDAPACHDQRVAWAEQTHPGTVVYQCSLAFSTYIFRNLRARKHFHAAGILDKHRRTLITLEIANYGTVAKDETSAIDGDEMVGSRAVIRSSEGKIGN